MQILLIFTIERNVKNVDLGSPKLPIFWMKLLILHHCDIKYQARPRTHSPNIGQQSCTFVRKYWGMALGDWLWCYSNSISGIENRSIIQCL